MERATYCFLHTAAISVAHWFNLSHVEWVNTRTWDYHNLYANFLLLKMYNVEWIQFANLLLIFFPFLTINLFLLLEVLNFFIIKYVFISVYLIFWITCSWEFSVILKLSFNDLKTFFSKMNQSFKNLIPNAFFSCHFSTSFRKWTLFFSYVLL